MTVLQDSLAFGVAVAELQTDCQMYVTMYISQDAICSGALFMWMASNISILSTYLIYISKFYECHMTIYDIRSYIYVKIVNVLEYLRLLRCQCAK